MDMKKCVIVGAGTYGQVYAEYLKEQYEIVGFIDDNSTIKNTSINGIKVLGNFEFLLKEISTSIEVFVPIGSNKIRVNLLKKLIDSGFETPSFIHSNTDIHPSVVIGKAVYILGATNVMPLSIIEDFTMISMGVNVAHHANVGEGSFLSQGSNIGASISLSKYSFVGIGSTIMTGVRTIGESALIGAGSVIIKDVPDYAVVVGNPGKIIKIAPSQPLAEK